MVRTAAAPELVELLERTAPGDTDFYAQYARYAGGPVLVLLCGTGRIAIAIAKQGIPVVGLDSDAALLDLARRKAQEVGVASAHFYRGDPTCFVSDSKHPLVLIPAGGLQRLLTLEEQRRCLEAARRAMPVGGKLVLDLPLLTPAALERTEPPVIRRYGATGERSAVLHRQRRYDPVRQVAEELAICQWLDSGGVVERTQYAALRSRWLTPGEALLLAQVAGLQAVAYGDFDRTPLRPGAAHLVLEATCAAPARERVF